MPVCQNCGTKWTWKQTIKTLFKLNCPHCREKQYEDTSTKFKSGFGIALGVLLPFSWLFDLSVIMSILIGFIFLLVLLATYPFILKLSNKEEPFW